MRSFFLFALFVSLLHAAERPIRIAPLPMVPSETLVRSYTALTHYLEEKTGQGFEVVYVAEYDALLDKIAKGEVDIAFLGPLPYVELTRLNSAVRPMVRFLDSKGEDKYTCTLFTTLTHDIGSVEQLKGKAIALTQKLSTCGYLATEAILRERGLSLEQNEYEFVGSHTNVIYHVAAGDYDAGTAKSSIVRSYAKVGVKPLATSPELPGFLWVSTPALDPALHEKIKSIMLGLDPLHNPEDAKRTKEWNKGIRYGCVPAEDQDYDVIRSMLETITIPK